MISNEHECTLRGFILADSSNEMNGAEGGKLKVGKVGRFHWKK